MVFPAEADKRKTPLVAGKGVHACQASDRVLCNDALMTRMLHVSAKVLISISLLMILNLVVVALNALCAKCDQCDQVGPARSLTD